MNLYLPITKKIRLKLFQCSLSALITTIIFTISGITYAVLLMPWGIWVIALVALMGVIGCGMFTSFLLGDIHIFFKLSLSLFVAHLCGLFDPLVSREFLLFQCIPAAFCFLGVYLDHSYIKTDQKITQQENQQVDSIGT